MTDHAVPPIGMRMVKTAVAVLICLLLSALVDREDMRVYSTIAALLCIFIVIQRVIAIRAEKAKGTAN